MGQRVKIQYSIDINELPRETQKILNKAFKILHNISMDAEDIATVEPKSLMTLKIMKELDKLRQELASVDFLLSDVSNIISGYVQFSADPVTHAPPSSDEESS